MFDLFRSRDKVVRFMLGGLLVIVAASMLLYLVPGGTPQSAAANDQVLVQFGRDTLTAGDVDRFVQSGIRNQRIPADLVPVMLPQMIDQMVHERAVAYEARRLGFQESDAELATTIQSIGNGQFNDRAMYERFVNEQGMTIPEFEDELRRQQLVMKMQNIVAESIVVTPEQARDFYVRQNEKAKVEYIAFNPEELKGKVNPSASDLQTWFNQNRGMFTTPEKRNVDLILVDQAKVGQTIQSSEAALRNYYSNHLDQYRVPERIKARHILFMTRGKPASEVPQIRKKAEEVLKQLRAGADFAELAKKNSDDTNSGPQGGELGWITHGQMVPNFEKATFALKPGQISDLITTEYGFHIIQVEDHEMPHLKTFDEVKGEISAELNKQAVFDKMQQIADAASVELTKSPQDAQQIADKYQVTCIHDTNFVSGQPIPGIGTDNNLGNAIQALKKNEVSQPVQVGTNRLVIADVRDITPSHPADFADVEQQVRATYIMRTSAEMASNKAKDALALLKKNGGDMEAAAKATGGTVKTSEEFTHAGAITGLGSAALFSEAFTKPVGSVIGPINSGGTWIAAKVLQVNQPNMNAFEAQRPQIVEQLKSMRSQDAYSLFADSVLSHLIAEGKIKYNKDAMDRVLAHYRNT